VRRSPLGTAATIGPGTDSTENVFSIIACSTVRETACPQSCSLTTAVVQPPVYTAVTSQ
jgi:hypothetical protein